MVGSSVSSVLVASVLVSERVLSPVVPDSMVLSALDVSAASLVENGGLVPGVVSSSEDVVV